MAEYIEREAALRQFTIDKNGSRIREVDVDNWLIEISIRQVKKMLREIPAADVAPVVRCKSCKHSKWSDVNKSYYCKRKWAMHKVRERDFCSYGKRRTDDDYKG